MALANHSTLRVKSPTTFALALILLWMSAAMAQGPRQTAYYRSPSSSAYASPYASSSMRASLSRHGAVASTGGAYRSSTGPYRLDAGDILAVIVDGVLGDFESAPVHTPKNGNGIQPAMGYPVPVRRNGTLDLPLVDSIPVRGLTARQAQERIDRVYRSQKILKQKNRVIATLLRKRTVSVTVIHDDPVDLIAPRSTFDLFRKPRQKVSVVQLPADQTHTLDALGTAGARFDAGEVLQVQRQGHSGNNTISGHNRLRDGAVVRLPAQNSDVYYTGGVLSGGPFPLDRDLNVLQAIAIADGSVNRFRRGRAGVIGPTDLVIVPNDSRRPTVRIDLNQAVRNPRAFPVRPGDTLTLQYKPNTASFER